MDIFFNELSVKEDSNKKTAKEWMANLMAVYNEAQKQGFRELKTTEAFINITLTPGYRLSEWIYDPLVDRELRRLFLTKVSKSPFIENLLVKKDGEVNLLHEFKRKGQKAAGLGAAYLFDSLAVSFDNSSEWDNHLIMLDISEYSEEEEKIIRFTERIKHSSKLVHLHHLKEWIENKKKHSIPNGKLLWLKRKELFPYLKFCETVESQISFLTNVNPEFNRIIKRLFELENYCSKWKTGIFTGKNFSSKVTPESESRRLKFKDELTFTCPDGTTRLFSWHARYTPGAGRIHFAPDNSKRTIYIGYIGQKIQ
jgi:hypothetical protein